MDLLQKTVLRTVSKPAENKWTKMQPAVSQILLMLSFCGVVQTAIRRLRPTQCQQEGPAPDFAEDLSHHPPRIRRERAFEYLTRPESKIELALWLAVAGQVMHVHFYLFETATWWSHRRSDAAGMHDFMDQSRNPAVKVVQHLSALLSEQAPLTPVSHLFGGVPVGQWPAWVRDRARVLLLKAVGMLWRHLWANLQRYPFLLAPLARPETPIDIADRVVQELRVAPACCVDKGFSGRWRDMQTGNSIDSDARLLFEVVFDRVVVTSTFVERIFADLSRWTRVRQGLPSLAAKHTLNKFASNRSAMLDPHTRRGRKRNQRHVLQESARSRPVWNQTKRANLSLSGFTLFKRTKWQETAGTLAERQAECHRRWSDLPEEDRAPFEQRALEERAVASKVPSRLEASESRMGFAPGDTDDPWGLGSLSTPHPLSPDALRDLLARPAGFQEAVAEWEALFEEVVQPDVHFRKGLETEHVCRVGECLYGLSAEASSGVQAMRETLRLLIRHTDFRSYGELPLLAYDVDGVSVYALVLEHSLDASCTATVCTLEPASGPGAGGQAKDGGKGLPFTLHVRHGGTSIAGKLPLDTETSFFKQLVARRSVVWRLSLLEWKGNGSFADITVVSRTAVTSATLQAKDAALQESERLMRLTRQLSKSKRSMRASHRGPGLRRDDQDTPGSSTDSDGDSEACSAARSSAAGSSACVLAPLPVVAAAPPPPPPPPLPQPPIDREPLSEPVGSRRPQGLRAGRGERSAESWGPFQIAEIWRSGSCIGVGARCGRHRNEGEDGRTACQKQVVFGQSGLEDTEIIRRLKRWLIAGFDDDDWGPMARFSHVRLGGPGLRMFATRSGQEGEDLDDMLGRRLQGGFER